jgi:hypothetical protein
LSTFFRGLALVVAICCLTWLGVLWWWQRSGHDIQVDDVVIYLALLPLVLVVLVLAMRWAWQSAGARQAAALAAAAAGGVTAAPAGQGVVADSAPGTDESARHTVMQLVNVAAFSTAGGQASDLLDAASEGKPMPVPDAELEDEQGLPVMCARISDKLLALDAMRSSLEDLLPLVRQGQTDWQALDPSEHVVRALAALAEPVQAQRDWLHNLLQLDADRRELGEPRAGGQARAPVLPSLRVLLGWPSDWSPFEQALGKALVEQILKAPDAGVVSGFALSWTSMVGAGEELWLKVDQIAGPDQAGARPDWLLVAACHSDLDQARVDALASKRQLFDAQTRPTGRMPGEAAAALLLAAADWAVPEALDLKPVRVHRPALARRGKGIEAGGRIDHTELGEALAQALTASQLEAAHIGGLVCDADQHSPRATELFGLSIASLPQLDPMEDMRLLGKVTGNVGAASLLLVIASAHDWARALNKPVLALGLADPFWRMAVVIKPGQKPDAETV